MPKRASGILLHISSLPSPSGIGDLGPGAFSFADFLHNAGQRFWQILPLNPTDPLMGNSPYSSISAFAGNPLFISPILLAVENLAGYKDIEPPHPFPSGHVDHHAVIDFKNNLFESAFRKFDKNMSAFKKFCTAESYWLDDFALFSAAKEHFKGKKWNSWPAKICLRDPHALKDLRKECAGAIHRHQFLQYQFYQQWFSLKAYCNKKNIALIGDMPIYVDYDSADVWSHQELFKLNREGRMTHVSGVPPDYFSQTGQRWGNPVYRWDAIKNTGFDWWTKRVHHALKLFDHIRIDHFRGLVAYWEIPAREKTAVKGSWIPVPGYDLFNTLRAQRPDLPIIAEDLGTITEDVRQMMGHFGFPGMKVLQFAFGDSGSKNPYLPHNHIENCIAYTGTHDNNTLLGWFKQDASKEIQRRLFKYLGRKVPVDELNWQVAELLMRSVAMLVMFPLQDILGLDEHARMNTPATSKGNWQWRFVTSQITPHITKKLLQLTEKHHRLERRA